MFSASLWISKMERQNSRAWQLFFLFLRHGAYNTHFFSVISWSQDVETASSARNLSFSSGRPCLGPLWWPFFWKTHVLISCHCMILHVDLLPDMFTIFSSITAQGGRGSVKNRKPIGEVSCCESRMAERSTDAPTGGDTWSCVVCCM